MQFQVTAIEYDFTGAEDEITDAEMNDIIDETIGHIWEADDEDDLIEEITSWTGWCINSMKVLTLIFIVALFLSPSVRTLTSNTLHTVADLISPAQ